MIIDGQSRTERRNDDNLELADVSLELDGVLLSACLMDDSELECMEDEALICKGMGGLRHHSGMTSLLKPQRSDVHVAIVGVPLTWPTSAVAR